MTISSPVIAAIWRLRLRRFGDGGRVLYDGPFAVPVAASASTLPLAAALARNFELADADPQERLIHYFRWGTPARLQPVAQRNPMQPASFVNLHRLRPPAGLVVPAAAGPESPAADAGSGTALLPRRSQPPLHRFHVNGQPVWRCVSPSLIPSSWPSSWRLPDDFKQRGRCGKWVFKAGHG